MTGYAKRWIGTLAVAIGLLVSGCQDEGEAQAPAQMCNVAPPVAPQIVFVPVPTVAPEQVEDADPGLMTSVFGS